ncbi:MAG: four helix bundle protein [Gemmatimonadaceae bacterium]
MNGKPSSAKTIRSDEDLQVYQTGMELLKPVLDLSLRLPEFEKYDLAQQLRRVSRSVPANMAEGYAKKRSAKECRAFLRMRWVRQARWSCTRRSPESWNISPLRIVTDRPAPTTFSGGNCSGSSIDGVLLTHFLQPPTSKLKGTNS